MTNLINNIFAFPIEDSANSLHVLGNNLLYRYESEKMPLSLIGDIDLPPGTWQIIFLTRDATNSDWEKVVDELFLGDKPCAWENYGFGLPKYKTATESGHSLLRSKGLNPDKNYCLIEKIC